MLFSVLMDSDAQAWRLLLCYSLLTTATLILVAVDKPFRWDDGSTDDDGMSFADKSMILAQACQLLNYGLAAICLRNKQSRMEQGRFGTDDDIELFAAFMVRFLHTEVAVLQSLPTK